MSSTANQTSYHYVPELVWGTTPATPAFNQLRYTSSSLDDSITTEKSQEIRSDRGVSDIIPVDASIGGGLSIEFSFDSYHDFLEALLMGTWTDSGVTDNFTTITAASDNVTAATPGAFDDVTVGQLIRLDGFVDTDLNRDYRVTAKADSQTLTVTPIPASAEVGAGTTLVGSWLKNGTTERSFSIEERFADASPATTRIFKGMRVGSLSLDLASGSLVTGEFSLLGKSAEWDEAQAGATYAGVNSTDTLNAVTNIDSLILGGSSLCASGAMSQMTFTYDNQHRERKGLCNLGSVGVVAGQIMAQVSATMYFVNATEAQKFKAATSFSLIFGLRDPADNVYDFYLPRMKYSQYAVQGDGLDSDVMADATIEGLHDATLGCTIIVSRLPGA